MSVTTTPPSRTATEAREILDAELERLADRREALGEGGVHAVAAWGLEMAYEFEAAALAWERTAAEEPLNAPAHLHLGLCHLELGALDAAESAFRASLEADRRAQAGEDEGRGEGLDWFEEDPHYRLGQVHHVRGDLEAACAAYDLSSHCNMTGVESLIELIRCRLVLKDGRGALADIERLVSRAARLSVRAEAEAYRAEAEALLADAAEDPS